MMWDMDVGQQRHRRRLRASEAKLTSGITNWYFLFSFQKPKKEKFKEYTQLCYIDTSQQSFLSVKTSNLLSIIQSSQLFYRLHATHITPDARHHDVTKFRDQTQRAKTSERSVS